MTRGGRTDIIATCLLLVGIWAVMMWDVFHTPRPLDTLGSPEMSCGEALSAMDAALPGSDRWLATRIIVHECLSEAERDPTALEAAFLAAIHGGQGACVVLPPLHRSRHAVGSRCTGTLDFTHFYHAMRLPHAEGRLGDAVAEAEAKLASGEWEDLPRRSHTTLIRRLEAMHTAAQADGLPAFLRAREAWRRASTLTLLLAFGILLVLAIAAPRLPGLRRRQKAS